MSLWRKDARRDANEPAIIAALMIAGAYVWRLPAPFDLLAAFRGRLYLIEVKTEDGKVTPNQAEDMELCEAAGVEVHVVKTIGEALAAIGASH